MNAMKRSWIFAMVALTCGVAWVNIGYVSVPPPNRFYNNGIFQINSTKYKYMGNGIVHVHILYDGDRINNRYIDTLNIPYLVKTPRKFGGYNTYPVTAVDLSDGDPGYSAAPEISYHEDISYTCPTVIISEGIDSIINFYPMNYNWYNNDTPLKLKDLWLPKSLKYIGPNAFFENYRDRAGNHYNCWAYWFFRPYADGLRIHVPDLEAWCAVEVDNSYLPPRTADYMVGDIFPQYTLCIGNDSVSDLVIPESVTEIGPRAFSGASIKSVKIHDGVKSIGSFAFSKCTYLESAVLPAGLREISPFAFSHCRSLQYIKIPKGVKINRRRSL